MLSPSPPLIIVDCDPIISLVAVWTVVSYILGVLTSLLAFDLGREQPRN